MGVLRQVAQFAGHLHVSGGRQGLSGDDPGQGGLAGPVAPDQADAVPLGDDEIGRSQQKPGADADFQTVSLDSHLVHPSAMNRAEIRDEIPKGFILICRDDFCTMGGGFKKRNRRRTAKPAE